MMRAALVLLLLFTVTSLQAQPGPPPDPDVPITGIEWLLLAGGALGVRKIHRFYKKQP